MTRIPHKWLIEWSDDAVDSLSGLTPRNRLRVFDAIAELAKAEDPTRVPGVGPLKAERDRNIWKRRKGDYRVFFMFESQEVVHLKFKYKGTLYILDIYIHHTGYDRD